MEHFHYLLRNCSNYTPVETWRIQLLNTIQPIPIDKKHIQILHSSSGPLDGHWVCSYYDRKNIFIYDSLNIKRLHEHHELFLKRLFLTYDFNKNPIKFPTVQHQLNYSDCGVFAIAFAILLLFNIQPDKVKYEQKLMRSHLIKILETNVIEHFPQDPQNVQKVFPLAVIKAREIEANRKCMMRQYEKKEQKLSQLKKCDNYITKKEFYKNYTKKRPHQDDAQDLENYRAKQRYRYNKNKENNRGKKRCRYGADIENNRAKKRMRYLTNSQNGRDRQKKINYSRKWLYNKRYYEKRKSMSSLEKQNCNIAKNIVKNWKIVCKKNIVKKYEKFRSKNYIKFNNPAAIKNIFNKLDIKNQVEKQLEAERIVRRCTQIRDSYVRDMYKILALLKKKSEICLSLATKCKTIDEKLKMCTLWQIKTRGFR
ncbi:hypothetical protein ALC62_00741 [Cyphomyrmex costatus]|uniref:Ubiquitin-like protease family profile domain-containing protein n=1 Tax=Cyphomyrmex costatus TaxID=456900 RepID=A0A151IQ64_9HYME|nr:hypothetical protein ALC62_00741 [Cyphomyrmex costatus]